MEMQVKFNEKQLADLVQALKNVSTNISKECGVVAWQTAKWTKAQIAKQVGGRNGLLNIKQADAKKMLVEKRRPAQSDGIRPSSVIFKRSYLSLKYFKPKQTRQGVAATIVRGQRTRFGKQSFMGPKPGVLAEKLNGQAFERVGPKRKPIRKLKGMTALAYWLKHNHLGPTLSAVEDRLIYHLRRRIKWLTLKQSGSTIKEKDLDDATT